MNRWGLISTPMRLAHHFARGAIASALLAGLACGQNVTTVSADTPAKGLHFATVPARVSQIVSTAVQSAGLGGVDASNLPRMDVSPPLAMYGVGDLVSLFASGKLDAEARLSSYSYFIKESGKLLLIVGLRADATGQPVKPASVALPLRATISDELDQVAKLLQIKMGSYEVRGLSFNWNRNGLLVLWLKSTPGGTDLIYPAFAYPNEYQDLGIIKGVLYTWPAFLAHLRAADKQERDAVAAKEAQQAATFAQNLNAAANGTDTTTTRLIALQSTLDTALSDLKKAPAGFFDQPIASVIKTEDAIAVALAYVKAHPEITSLHNQDQLPFDPGLGRYFVFYDTGQEPEAATVLIAADTLRNGLNDFLGNPFIGRPLVGEIGGNRDLIMRDIGAATGYLLEAAGNFMQAKHPESALFARGYSPFVVLPESSAPPGSISGTVVPQMQPPPVQSGGRVPAGMIVPGTSSAANGAPVPYAKISLNAINSLADDFNGSVPIPTPATYSDEHGSFVIKNVPPGFYILTAGAGWIRIEVKEGAETKLSYPLMSLPLAIPGPLNRISSGGGG